MFPANPLNGGPIRAHLEFFNLVAAFLIDIDLHLKKVRLHEGNGAPMDLGAQETICDIVRRHARTAVQVLLL